MHLFNWEGVPAAPVAAAVPAPAAARAIVATVADTVTDKALREIFVAGAQEVIDPL